MKSEKRISYELYVHIVGEHYQGVNCKKVLNILFP